MFVHGIKDDRPLVLMLKKDELGQALRDNVQEKCPKLPSSFILLHQGRKVLLSGWTSCEYFFILSLDYKVSILHSPLIRRLDFRQFLDCFLPSTSRITKVKMSIPTSC